MSFESASQQHSTGAFGSISHTLLHRVQQNDRAARSEVVDVYGPLVYRWCRRSLQPNDAADVVQEVFLSVLRGIGAFQYDRPNATFRGWLRTITRNKVLDALRKQDRLPIAEGGSAALQKWSQIADSTAPLDAENPDDSLLDEDEFQVVLHGALEVVRHKVQENTWQAFWQTVVEQHDTQEVAERLQMKAGSVRNAKMRVLRHLQELLGEDLPGFAGKSL